MDFCDVQLKFYGMGRLSNAYPNAAALDKVTSDPLENIYLVDLSLMRSAPFEM